MRGRVSILHGFVASAGVARVCVFIFIVPGFEVSVSCYIYICFESEASQGFSVFWFHWSILGRVVMSAHEDVSVFCVLIWQVAAMLSR